MYTLEFKKKEEEEKTNTPVKQLEKVTISYTLVKHQFKNRNLFKFFFLSTRDWCILDTKARIFLEMSSCQDPRRNFLACSHFANGNLFANAKRRETSTPAAHLELCDGRKRPCCKSKSCSSTQFSNKAQLTSCSIILLFSSFS